MEKQIKKDAPTMEELIAELAAERVKNEKLKAATDKALSDTAKYKKRIRELEQERKFAADEKDKEKATQEKEFEELKKELEITRFSQRFVGLGMDEEKAEETARFMLEKDMDNYIKNINLLIEKLKMRARDEAVQKLLSNRIDIYAGHGDIDRTPSIDVAERYMNQRGEVDVEALKRFT